MQHQPHHAAKTPPHLHTTAVVVGGGLVTTATSSSKKVGGEENGVEIRGGATSLRNRNRHSSAAPSPPIRAGNLRAAAISACCGVPPISSSNNNGRSELSSAILPPTLVVSSTGFIPKSQDRISLAIQNAGHRYNSTLSGNANVLVVSSDIRDSVKFVRATQRGIPCVTEDWVIGGKVRRSLSNTSINGLSPVITTSGGAPGSETDPNFYPPCSVDLLNNRHDCVAVMVTALTWGTITTSGFHPEENALLSEMLEPLQVKITGSLTLATRLLVIPDSLQNTIPSSNNSNNHHKTTTPTNTTNTGNNNKNSSGDSKYAGSNMKVSFALKKGIPIMTLTAFLKTHLPGRIDRFLLEVKRRQLENNNGSSSFSSSVAVPPSTGMRMAAKETSPTIVVLSSSTTYTSTDPSSSSSSFPTDRKIQQACLELGLVRLPVDVLLSNHTSSSFATSSSSSSVCATSPPPCTYILVDIPTTTNVSSSITTAGSTTTPTTPPPLIPEVVLDALNPTVSSKHADCIRKCYFVTLAWLWESHRQRQLLNPCGAIGSGMGEEVNGHGPTTTTLTSSRPTSNPSSSSPITTTTQFQWVPHYITLCRVRSTTEKREILDAASKLGAVVLSDLLLTADLKGSDGGGEQSSNSSVYSHHRPVSTTHIVCGMDTVPNITTSYTSTTTNNGVENSGCGVSLSKIYDHHTISSKLRKVWSVKGSWCHVVTPSWLLQSAALGRWVEEESFTIHPPPPTLTITSKTIGEKRQRDDEDGHNNNNNNTRTGLMTMHPHPITATTTVIAAEKEDDDYHAKGGVERTTKSREEGNQHHQTNQLLQTNNYEKEELEAKEVVANALALLFDGVEEDEEIKNGTSTTSVLPSSAIANHGQTQYNHSSGDENGEFLSQITGTTPPKMPTPNQQEQFPYSLGKYDAAYGNNNNIQKMPSPPPKILDSQHVVYHHDDGDCGPATSWQNGLSALGELYKKGSGGGPPAGILFGDIVSAPAVAARSSSSAYRPSGKAATIDIDDEDGGGEDDDAIPVDCKIIESEHLIRAAQPSSVRHHSTTTTSMRSPMPPQVNEGHATTAIGNNNNSTTSAAARLSTTSASSTTNNGRASPTTTTTTSMPNNVPTSAATTTNNNNSGGGGGVTHVLFIAKAARDHLPNNICTLVQDLGGDIAMTADACTHYICTKPVKTETLLCCLASGKWILSPKYLEDLLMMHANEVEAGNIPPVSNGRASVSSTAGGGGGVGGTVSLSVIGSTYYPNRIASLKEESYEWSSALIFSANNSGGSFSGSSASLGTSTSALADACPRQRKSLTRCFSSWKVVLICSVASRTTSFTKVLVAGGCTILASYTKEELQEAAANNNTADKNNDDGGGLGGEGGGGGAGSRLLAVTTRSSINNNYTKKQHRTIEIPPETTHVLCDDDALTTTPLIRPLVKTAILQGPLKAAVRTRVAPGSTMSRSGNQPITTRLGSGSLNNNNNNTSDNTLMTVASATKYGSTLAPHFHGALRMEFLVHALCVERHDPSIFIEIDFSSTT